MNVSCLCRLLAFPSLIRSKPNFSTVRLIVSLHLSSPHLVCKNYRVWKEFSNVWFSGVVPVKTCLLEPNLTKIEQRKHYVNTYVDISAVLSIHHLNKYLS